jgi:hypothetical protein
LLLLGFYEITWNPRGRLHEWHLNGVFRLKGTNFALFSTMMGDAFKSPVKLRVSRAGHLARRLRMRREPQRARGLGWIEPEFLPPSGFIAVAMELAMMSSVAER